MKHYNKKLEKERDLSSRYRKIEIRAVAAAAAPDTTKAPPSPSDDQKMRKGAKERAGR
jgi:hypothetical protein